MVGLTVGDETSFGTDLSGYGHKEKNRRAK
jgi:hypothetical protein